MDLSRSKLYLVYTLHIMSALFYAKVLQLGDSTELLFLDFDLADVLPAMDDLLTSPYLVEAGVAGSTQFRFLVSAGFEQLGRLHSSD